MKILSAEFITSATGPKQFPKDRKPQIAFAGKSNVGKSSLINALLHRKNLVKTSATPGKTQLVNFFLVNGSFYFVDLPGYGFARVPHAVTDTWAPMIEGYIKESPALVAVVVLLDCRRDPDERDLRMLTWLDHYGIPAICVVTKADKLNRQEQNAAVRSISAAIGTDRSLLLTSAPKGAGIKELWGAINAGLSRNARQEAVQEASR